MEKPISSKRCVDALEEIAKELGKCQGTLYRAVMDLRYGYITEDKKVPKGRSA